jgi:hypothetical protein
MNKNINPYAVWVTIHTGRYLLTFKTLDDAHLFIIKFGGGLEVIPNTFENF